LKAALNAFLGPALGALLFSLGGFQLPFLVVGSIGLVVATCLLLIIPNVKADPEKKKTAKLINYAEIAKVSLQ
jgi:predicted MFS family arabinose efflux permease